MEGQVLDSGSGNGLIAERAYHELRDRIVTLQLPPGAILREDELMRELGIGRTPLREAVKRLALENLVAVQPRRGTFVTHVDVADIVHITEVRVELEAQAAELAALRMDADARARAEALVTELATLSSRGPRRARCASTSGSTASCTQRPATRYLAETLERYFALSLRVLVRRARPRARPRRRGARPGAPARGAARTRPPARPRDHARAHPRLPTRDPRGLQPSLSPGEAPPTRDHREFGQPTFQKGARPVAELPGNEPPGDGSSP